MTVQEKIQKAFDAYLEATYVVLNQTDSSELFQSRVRFPDKKIYTSHNINESYIVIQKEVVTEGVSKVPFNQIKWDYKVYSIETLKPITI